MKKYHNYDLSQLSYYQTGGTCACIYFPESIEEVSEALKEIQGDFFILGLGSNSLVLDEPWDGAVLCLKDLNHIEKISDDTLRVYAGAINSDLAEFALSQGLGGVYWMYGLPGMVGATVRMNARCYGGEISQVVTKVVTVDPEGQIKTYANHKDSKEIFEAYKKTIFMSNREVVVMVEMQLQTAELSDIKYQMMRCYKDRVKKGQYLHPSCGCVFKNNYKPEVSVPSGLLIDHCSLRGTVLGGAKVSEQHANFISNEKGASSTDILQLSFCCERKSLARNWGVA